MALSAAAGPFQVCIAVSANDSNVFFKTTNSIYVGNAGNVAITTWTKPDANNTPVSGNVTFVSVAAGTILPVKATKILATGTTATNLVALF